MKQTLRTLGLACALGLGACAYPNPQHVAALNALVGKSEADLVRTLGVPSRTYDTGGHRFLAFSRSKLETIPGDPGFGPWGGGFWGGPYWWGAAGAAGAAFRPKSSNAIAKRLLIC